MTKSAGLRACLVAAAAILTNFFNVPVQAQTVRPTHEIRKGDTLFAVARKAKHQGATRNQMIIAIYRANPQVFPGGDPNRLVIGSVLNIPPRETVLALDTIEADRLVRELMAMPMAVLPPPAARPAPGVAPPADKPLSGASLSRSEATRRFREGLALERGGDDKDALRAFLDAAESGHGPAQRKLGEIYDKGNSAVERDYETALKWYQRAREQGIEIRKPFVRSPR